VTHLWAIVLGIVQGIAEFLPISSTAHLKLIPWMFGVRDPMLSSTAFDIALHAGSFVAILIALWRDWVDLVRGALGRPASGASDDAMAEPSFARKFIGFLALTTIPAALIGMAFDTRVEKYSTPDIAGTVSSGIDAQTFHYAPLVLGIAMILFGILLWAADRYVKRKDALTQMTWLDALLVGLAQAVALVPGVSRSGATMTMGRLVGLRREDVARYSFMAALPIIGGAAVYGLGQEPLSTIFSLDWVLGFLAAAVSSVLVMRWMLSYVRNHSFALFMWYRIAFGLLVIALFFVRG
jgi:undecaprenyl-diphosphatase